jgi:hypothetical protein
MLIESIMCAFELRRNIWNNSQSDPAALYDNTATLVGRYPQQKSATS